MDDEILRRVPPQNLEAEQSVLGAILLDNSALSSALELLAPEDFYRESHRGIFRAMASLGDRSHPIDAVTLTEELRTRGALETTGGPGYIAELASIVPSAAHIEHYSRIVRDKGALRGLAAVSAEVQSGCYDNPGDADSFLDSCERRLLDAMSRRARPGFHSMREMAADALRLLEELHENREHLTGVSTGFPDLDRLTAGLQPGELVIIAARPSMGKTALALNIAVNAALAKRPVPVALFSLEMSRRQLAVRMLCSEARIDSARVRGGYVRSAEWPVLAETAERLADAPIFIDDNCDITPMQLKAACRRMKADPGLGLVMVDYLQLMAPSRARDNREREVAEISRALKSLAKELDVPVLAMSQLNRQVETRADRRPMLADLRESGAIEQDADVIAFIYRDDMYHRDSKQKGLAEIIVAKQRNGPCDTVRLSYAREFTRFDNYASAPEESR